MISVPPPTEATAGRGASHGGHADDGEGDHLSEDRVRLASALVLVGDGNRAAFRTVYSLTCNRLFGISLRIVRDHATAEDILADVYLTIWKRAGAWDPARGSAMTWLSTIARNRAIDWSRARGVRGVAIASDSNETADDAPDAGAILLTTDRYNHVARCLQALAPLQRSSIHAAFFDGRTYAELASRNGIPVGTMKSLVRRGLAQIRRDLEADDRSDTFASQQVTQSEQTAEQSPLGAHVAHGEDKFGKCAKTQEKMT